ncbi:MAG: DUF2877 domain-containing protein [Chloroflexi bacterium]|nr:DUF2877 domain-containing protein [Chloroflexota bacterium]
MNRLLVRSRNIGTANLIGATARELLARSDFSGRVIAVVSGAVYVQTDPHPNPPPFAKSGRTSEGEIVWLAQMHLPMHARAILGAFDFSALRVGMELYLAVGATHASPLHIANARVWQPATIDLARVAPRQVVIARIQDLTGFGKPVRSSLCDLIGLGEGLTPAGDDFVGGFLFARWHLHAAYPATTTWDQRAVDDLLEYARTRTNDISHTILRDHARGQSVAPIHDLIAAFLAPQTKTPNAIQHHVQRLLAIGSTSGKEMLAGLLNGITNYEF